MKTIIFPLLLTLFTLLSMPLSAAPYQQSNRQFEDADRRNISRQQAADIAQREHPGRVLGVKRNAKNYRVRTLNRRGELRETRINARNGKVVRRR